MKYDHYESNINWLALIIWTWLTLVTAWGVWMTYKDIQSDKRMTDIENWQGPAMPTEWTIVNGKVTLYQSPYTIQVAP